MLRRRAINSGGGPAGLASTSASEPGAGRRVLWALEERLILGGDALRALADSLKWPFERIAWTAEQRLVWPLQARTATLSPPLRLGGATGVTVIAIAATALGVVLASDGASSTEPATPPAAISVEPQREALAEADPVLRGVAPDFTPEADGGTGKVASAEAIAKAPDSPAEAAAAASSSSAEGAEPVGPAAIEVAHRFAGAFVRYETGVSGTEVRSTFHRTATPQLARALLQRPPRLPANVEVPKAKVLNVVPGPSEAGVHTISVSLLRVGLTSELRLDMEREEKTGKWQVTDVRG
jgi:hypothetical protein